MAIATEVMVDRSRTIISENDSPDLPFNRSLNPYRGCEHGCIYCYARPSHAWLDLSPGLDFESRLFHKPAAPELLRAALAGRHYRCEPIAIGVNTDAYQPIERRYGTTRAVIELLAESRHPFSLITKSSLVERDIDLLAPLARERLVEVAISLTTLDRAIARSLEPRAAAPQRRLTTIARLTAAGIPTRVMVAPVIPGLTDHELEAILAAARQAGAWAADYALLRLPYEVEGLFEEWLAQHQPLRAAKVMALLRASRGGKSYDSRFGQRLRGSGVLAELLQRRFSVALRRLAFPGIPTLDCGRFQPPNNSPQLDLF